VLVDRAPVKIELGVLTLDNTNWCVTGTKIIAPIHLREWRYKNTELYRIISTCCTLLVYCISNLLYVKALVLLQITERLSSHQIHGNPHIMQSHQMSERLNHVQLIRRNHGHSVGQYAGTERLVQGPAC
jgi:hypothetical protein